MRDPGIVQAHEPEHAMEVIPGDAVPVDGIQNPRVSENNGTNLEITELTQEVYRLAERARNLLGRPDLDLDREEIPPDALAALASIEAQSEWKVTERFDMPGCQPTPVCRETQRVKNIHEVLRQKERELTVLQDEIEALRRVLPLLSESQHGTVGSASALSRSRQLTRIP